MKKKLLFGKIMFVIGILILAMGISYVITYYFDRSLFTDINLTVTFEDTKTFKLENTNKLTKDEVLLTYPYIFTVENNSFSSVSYNILINDITDSIDKSKLDYLLYLNDSLVKSGNLSDIENKMYQNKIKINGTDTYKLYVYFNEEIDDASYEYKIEITSN